MHARVHTIAAAALVAAFATPSPIVWLLPPPVPPTLFGIQVPFTRWVNSARTGFAFDAVTDATAGLNKPPAVTANATATGTTAVSFASPGPIGVGTNLVVDVNLAVGSSSVFFLSKLTGTGDRGQRLVGARHSNYALGYWQGDRYPTSPRQGVAYCSPTDNGVFLATLYAPATHDWLLYEAVVDGAAGVGIVYENGVAICGAGPCTGPNGLRLGGGGVHNDAEFGTGLIAEVMVFNITLSAADRVAVENYFFVKYGL